MNKLSLKTISECEKKKKLVFDIRKNLNFDQIAITFADKK